MGLRTPIPLEEPTQDQELFDSVLPQRTLGETLRDAAAMAEFDTAVISLARISAVEEAESRGGAVVPAAELNKQFPGLPNPFTESMNMNAARLIADEQLERVKLSDRIRRGPQGYFASTLRFGSGMLMHALDPIEFGAGAVVSGVAPFTVGRAAIAGRLGYVAKPTAGQIFSRSALEGVVGNAIVEPLPLYAAEVDNSDYTALDSFMGVVGGAVGFAGVRFGVAKFSPVVRHGISKTAAFFQRLGPKHSKAVMQTAVGQLGADKAVNILPLQKQFVDEASGRFGDLKYNFKRFSSADLPKTKFYAGSEFSKKTDLKIGKAAIIEDDFGNAIYLSDNPNVANGSAVRGMNSRDGQVFAVDMKEANLANLDIPPRGKIKEAVEPVVKKLFPEKQADKILAEESTKSIFDRIKRKAILGEASEEVFEEVKQAFKEKGFDGYQYEGGRFLDTEGPPHNMLVMFDESKFSKVESLSPSRDAVRGLNEDELAKVRGERLSRESDLLFDESEAKEFRSELDAPTQDQDLAKLVEREKVAYEDLAELERQGLLSEEDRKIFSELKEQEKIDAELDKAEKAAFICLGRRGG